jgi:hypothetical protein
MGFNPIEYASEGLVFFGVTSRNAEEFVVTKT